MSIEKSLEDTLMSMKLDVLSAESTDAGNLPDLRMSDKLKEKAFERNACKKMVSELQPEVTFEERWALLQAEKAETNSFWRTLESQMAISKQKRVTLDPSLGGCPGYNPMDGQNRYSQLNNTLASQRGVLMSDKLVTFLRQRHTTPSPVPLDDPSGHELTITFMGFESNNGSVSSDTMDKLMEGWKTLMIDDVVNEDTPVNSTDFMECHDNCSTEKIRMHKLSGMSSSAEDLNIQCNGFPDSFKSIVDLGCHTAHMREAMRKKTIAKPQAEEAPVSLGLISSGLAEYTEWYSDKHIDELARKQFLSEWVTSPSSPVDTWTNWLKTPDRSINVTPREDNVEPLSYGIDFSKWEDAIYAPKRETTFMSVYPSIAAYKDLKEQSTEGPYHVEDATADGVEAGVSALYSWIVPEGANLKEGSWTRICCFVGPNNKLVPANYRSKPIADPFKVKQFIDTYTG